MSAYTRVTLTGADANVEVLLPSTETVDSLLPEVVRFLALPTHIAPRRLVLTPVGGPSLDGSRTLEQAGIADGALLTVASQDDAVSSPLVYDVTDHVATRFGVGQDAWAVRGRSQVMGTCLVALLLLAYWWLAAPFGGIASAVVASVVIVVLFFLVALLPQGRFPLSWALLASGLGIAVMGVGRASLEPTVSGLVLLGVAFLAVEAWHLHGRRVRAAVLGAATMAILVGIWVGCIVLIKDAGLAAALAGTVSVFLLGYLPRLALGTAGLNTLDDERHQQRPVERSSVEAALAQAHSGLVSAAAWCSLSLLLAGAVLLGSPVPPVWALPLAACWILVTALRVRSFPLTAQRWVSTVAVLALVAVYIQRLSTLGTWVGLALGGVALLTAILLSVPSMRRLPDHVWARLRLAADRVETLATVAIVPLLLGLFGVYQIMLSTFGG